MAGKITPALIREQGSQLHALDIAEARAAELAREVEAHVTAIRTAAERLDFNDEPGRFTALLTLHAEPRKKRA